MYNKPNILCKSSDILYQENSLNTLRPRQNGQHFPDDIFKCIFLNENISISINISLKLAHKGQINNNPALVQIMAKSHFLNQWLLFCWRIYVALGLNELNHKQLEMHGCVLSTVATDALVLKHQAISFHNTD